MTSGSVVSITDTIIIIIRIRSITDSITIGVRRSVIGIIWIGTSTSLFVGSVSCV